MTIPTLGHPEIWPLLAPRLAPKLKPRLGQAVKAVKPKAPDSEPARPR